jgi:hypothetical protein
MDNPEPNPTIRTTDRTPGRPGLRAHCGSVDDRAPGLRLTLCRVRGGGLAIGHTKRAEWISRCDARRSHRPAADSSWCSLAAIGSSQASCAAREWISPDGRQSNRVRTVVVRSVEIFRPSHSCSRRHGYGLLGGPTPASWKRAKARRGVGWILDHGSSAARRPFIRGWPNNGSIRLSFTSRPSLRSSVVPEKEMVAGSDQLSQPVGVGAPPAEVPRETCGRGH